MIMLKFIIVMNGEHKQELLFTFHKYRAIYSRTVNSTSVRRYCVCAILAYADDHHGCIGGSILSSSLF